MKSENIDMKLYCTTKKTFQIHYFFFKDKTTLMLFMRLFVFPLSFKVYLDFWNSTVSTFCVSVMTPHLSVLIYPQGLTIFALCSLPSGINYKAIWQLCLLNFFLKYICLRFIINVCNQHIFVLYFIAFLLLFFFSRQQIIYLWFDRRYNHLNLLTWLKLWKILL